MNPTQLSEGTKVVLRDDSGKLWLTETRSAPWMLGDTWVVLVDGWSGGYSVSRLTKVVAHG